LSSLQLCKDRENSVGYYGRLFGISLDIVVSLDTAFTPTVKSVTITAVLGEVCQQVNLATLGAFLSLFIQEGVYDLSVSFHFVLLLIFGFCCISLSYVYIIQHFKRGVNKKVKLF
jgi:hypothetical protein